MYLIYETQQEALDRSEQEGIRLKFSYYITGRGTRYVTSPIKTPEDKWALPVKGYELTETETDATVEAYS